MAVGRRSGGSSKQVASTISALCLLLLAACGSPTDQTVTAEGPTLSTTSVPTSTVAAVDQSRGTTISTTVPTLRVSTPGRDTRTSTSRRPSSPGRSEA